MLLPLLGSGMGMIVAHFQRCGIVLLLRALLYMFVRYLMASGPSYLRCLMFTPLWPVELLFVLFEMASRSCVVVKSILSVVRFLIVWLKCPLLLFAVYGVMFVIFLLKAFALPMFLMAVLVSKRMLLFCCVGGFLLDSFAIVPQRECVSPL